MWWISRAELALQISIPAREEGPFSLEEENKARDNNSLRPKWPARFVPICKGPTLLAGLALCNLTWIAAMSLPQILRGWPSLSGPYHPRESSRHPILRYVIY